MGRRNTVRVAYVFYDKDDPYELPCFIAYASAGGCA